LLPVLVPRVEGEIPCPLKEKELKNSGDRKTFQSSADCRFITKNSRFNNQWQDFKLEEKQ